MIGPGDIVYMDTYNMAYEGYKTCYYRTFSCGKASQAAKDDYKLALQWLYDGINIIKPGVTTREIAEKWPPGPEVWKDINIVSEDQTAGSNWGHGIGLSLYEPPIIWRAVSLNSPDVVLEENMTFAVETQHGRPGVHGVRLEEMVRVTKTGVEVLTKFPVDEITEVPIV
jgi:Xaa-Pro aminopeptidase